MYEKLILGKEQIYIILADCLFLWTDIYNSYNKYRCLNLSTSSTHLLILTIL